MNLILSPYPPAPGPKTYVAGENPRLHPKVIVR